MVAALVFAAPLKRSKPEIAMLYSISGIVLVMLLTCALTASVRFSDDAGGKEVTAIKKPLSSIGTSAFGTFWKS